MKRVVFFGNTKYSLIGLEILHRELGIFSVVTIDGNPTEKFARENSIPIITTKKLTEEVAGKLKKIGPDFFVVEDYGLILPLEVLNIPKILALNVHHSLLPKYRGASPAPSAILAGEKVTGVSIIRMTKDVDAGDILAQKEYSLSATDTTDSVLTILNKIGAELTIDVIRNFGKFQNKARKQDESKATFTKFMKKDDGKIDLSSPPPPEKLDRMVRAYFPWPGVWFVCHSERNEESHLEGKIIKLLPEQKIQVEGKSPMPYKDFINGYAEGSEILKKLGLN